LFRAPTGEEITSSAVVYFDTDIPIGDYIALGDVDHVLDPTLLHSAYRVRQFRKIPDLRAVQMERKAYL
jgi:hypothetical protein